MQIDTRTLFIPLIVESLVLFLVSILLARHSESNRRGMSWLAGALGLTTLSFSLFGLRHIIPEFASTWLANISLTAATTLGTLSICSFQGIRAPHWTLWGPSLLIALALLLLPVQHPIDFPASITYTVHTLQGLYNIYLLVRARHHTDGFGQYLIVGALLSNVIALLIRLLSMVIGVAPLHTLTDIPLPQGLLYLSTFIAICLGPIGYILMTLELQDYHYRRLALQDKLTGCWNRAYLEQIGIREIQRLRRHGHPVALVMLDLDWFKSINDRFGHATGDAVLKGFAQIVRNCIRTTDVFARWGGEEFVVLLPASTAEAAACLAERIRTQFSQASFSNAHTTVSAGYIACRTDDTWESWFQRADAALYRAKLLGRNCIAGEAASQQVCLANKDLAQPEQQQRDFSEATLDEQHLYLFHLAKRIFLDSTPQAQTDSLASDLDEFLNYLHVHFQTENRLLEQYDNPASLTHLTQHRQLEQQLLALSDQYHQNSIEFAELRLFVLQEMILRHALNEDREMLKMFVNSNKDWSKTPISKSSTVPA